jgi:hypothetical protein
MLTWFQQRAVRTLAAAASLLCSTGVALGTLRAFGRRFDHVLRGNPGGSPRTLNTTTMISVSPSP